MREATIHIHSPEFREEFYPLIRNDEIHAKLFCLHLWLLADRLRHSSVAFSFTREYYEFR